MLTRSKTVLSIHTRIVDSTNKFLLFYLEKAVGIPEFWLQVFRNSDVLAELIKVFYICRTKINQY
jgi:hypothetical protein